MTELTPPVHLRADLQIIYDHIPAGARVLDIGCGSGTLLAALRDTKGVDGRGLELDADKVSKAVARGLSVIQGDANSDLNDYLTDSFDCVVLSQTLPATERPDRVLDELLRIGREAFVAFPNFAHWRGRMALGLGGRMPVTKLLPERWYDTPNIHHVTIDDFRALLRERSIRIEGQWFLSGDRQRSPSAANLLADHAVFLLSRAGAS